MPNKMIVEEISTRAFLILVIDICEVSFLTSHINIVLPLCSLHAGEHYRARSHQRNFGKSEDDNARGTGLRESKPETGIRLGHVFDNCDVIDVRHGIQSYFSATHKNLELRILQDTVCRVSGLTLLDLKIGELGLGVC